MGCINSKKDINDYQPNVFQVCNIDEDGNDLSPGRLEVNDTEIVLHQRHKPPIRWPLKTLRRYGYDSQVFSFETGRRCPTGSGVYAFSCRRAERIFNYLQAHVQMRNNDETMEREVPEQQLPRPSPQDPNYLEPIAVRQKVPRLSINNGPASQLSSIGSSNGLTSPLTPNQPNYINDDVFKQQLVVPEEEAPLPLICAPLTPPVIDSDSNAAIYMNINPQQSDANNDHVADNDGGTPHHCYANLVLGDYKQITPPEVVAPISPSTPPRKQLLYAILDLDQQTVPSSPINGQCQDLIPSTPQQNETPQSYVTIDFDRTVALSYVVNNACNNLDGESSRKTRHDTICEFPPRQRVD